MQRLAQPVGPERKIKAVSERMLWDVSKPLGEPLGVAEIAAARDLRAARDRVPCRIRPFNLRRC